MAIDPVSHLGGAAIRACALGLIAFGGLRLFRVRSPAARHATWTVVVLGMLLQIALGSAVPGVRLKVLPTVSDPSQRAMVESPRTPVPPPRALSPVRDRRDQSRRALSPAGVLIGVYFGVSMLLFARIALGLWGLRRILRNAKPLPELGRCFFESASFRIPAWVGCFRARILLPRGWDGWDSIKPLAWWIDRELADLAEEACDEIALSEIEDRDQYAATLVEFARAAAADGRLLNWGAVSMPKESNVARRFNRIMDWRLPAAKPFGRMAWVMLLTCGMPLIYLSAAVKLAPGNRSAAGLDRAAVYVQPLEIAAAPLRREPSPIALMAQAAPNPPLRSAPPIVHAVSICILIDNSGSMRGKRNEVKAAALALVGASKPGDELCIVGFNDEVFVNADLAADFGRATDALRQIESRGGSALRDAIQISAGLLEQKAHNRKVLVLITDGNDTSSVFTEAQLRDKIKNSGVLVYSIALLNEKDSGKASEARRTLTQLAALTGGLYYYPEAPAEIQSIVSQIELDARNK